MDDHQVKHLMTTINCTECGRRYEAGDIGIVYHQQELWFISVSCRNCGARGLVAALIKEGSNAPVITDLTPEELARFSEAAPVSADDVLDVHLFLEGFDGNFGAQFQS
jgi:hypothetical protein